MRRTYCSVFAFVSAVLISNGCAQKTSSEIPPARLAAFNALPAVIASEANPITEEKIALGRMLYYDTRLSKSQKVSCNSCHDLAKYGVDNQPTSEGHRGQRGDRNSPTVYNAAGHFVQFWDGRAGTVEDQAKGPVMNPVEMAMPSAKVVVATLKSIPGYVQAFGRAFPNSKDPVTIDNMANAIGAFERKLVTPAKWDKFLAGDANALTPVEKAGFIAFADAGCVTCHAGAYAGGNLYQKVGLVQPWPDTSDPGRFKVTKNEADRMVFKVPSLRNVEKTGPYFHNGKTGGLEDAVKMMAQYQLGKDLKPEEAAAIAAWLRTLTGTIPTDYIRQPELPKSTAKTPKPDLTD